MDREEYKKEAEKVLNKEYISRATFPELLLKAAQELFLIKDMDSDFSLETRRRLEQLIKNGWTD